MASNGKSFALVLQIHRGQEKPLRYYYLHIQSMDSTQSHVGDADRVGFFFYTNLQTDADST